MGDSGQGLTKVPVLAAHHAAQQLAVMTSSDSSIVLRRCVHRWIAINELAMPGVPATERLRSSSAIELAVLEFSPYLASSRTTRELVSWCTCVACMVS
jgi:hypothetical protein